MTRNRDASILLRVAERDQVNRPAATSDRQVERPYRRVRLNASLGDWRCDAPYHNGLLSVSANEENMMLKLTLTRSFSLTLMSTECSR
jgi:hypothetical protein